MGTLRDIQLQFSRIYVCLLARIGLTLPQYTLLNALSRVAPMTMTEASERLHITKPAVTHLVDHLEKKKCLKRIAHENDRRIYLLEVTPKGQKIVKETQAQMFQYLLESFDTLADSEKKVIERFYGMLSERLTEVLVKEKEK
jgi:DNA-binding MarR family transcriptional regulator